MNAKIFVGVIMCAALAACDQKQNTDTDGGATSTSAKTVLLHQLKTTHNKKEWFVPVNTALDGVTPAQAMWRDSSGNHSIGQLAYHLLFWNKRQLANFRGEPEGEFSGNNEETFDSFDASQWEQVKNDLDAVLGDIEAEIEKADEATLAGWTSTIANISVHNAYHTGQIVSVRKLQGSWDPKKGV